MQCWEHYCGWGGEERVHFASAQYKFGMMESELAVRERCRMQAISAANSLQQISDGGTEPLL